MKRRISPAIKAHLLRGAFFLLPFVGACVIPFALAQWQVHAPSSEKNPTIVCNNSWQAGPDMPSTGVRMVGVYFPPNGRFYAMGGRSMDGVGNDFAHPFEYDPTSNSWAIKSATYPDNQVSDMACGVLHDFAGDHYIYCVGGSAGGQTTATNRMFRYNPIGDYIERIDGRWGDGVTLPGGFAVFNNKLYILGGFRINTAMTNQIWEFTPFPNPAWVLKNAVLPVARGYIPTAVIYSGFSFIYTAGGSDWNGTALVDTNDSFRYDPVADSITTIPNIPRATAETRALVWQMPDTYPYIYVMGGGRTPPNPSYEVDGYYPSTNTWSTSGHFMTARRNFATDSDGGCAFSGCTGHIWLAGGYASDGVTPLSSMETLCVTWPATPTPTPLRPFPTPRPAVTPKPRPTPLPRL